MILKLIDVPAQSRDGLLGTKQSSRGGIEDLEQSSQRETWACKPNEWRICDSVAARVVPKRQPWAQGHVVEISMCPAKTPTVKSAEPFSVTQIKSNQQSLYINSNWTEINGKKKRKKEGKRKRDRGNMTGCNTFNRNYF